MKSLLLTLLFALMIGSAAAAQTPFTAEKFQQAQAEDKVILIDIYAEWCPTCRRQSKIINEYFTANPDSKIQLLTVDFDSQKDWATHFKAPRQSTLLVYKGFEQIHFSVAETSKERIFKTLSDAEQAN
ncbi:thioredoxin family protein [Arsukibacterium perlucidum]|uniref:thioredoxin family protein n=1 Tax=Arsukibacterium perlucidum TaxID=368811 RepID=UPI00037BD9E6|nr:thioredoxin family protein [Arsukibacterium perlucidum]